MHFRLQCGHRTTEIRILLWVVFLFAVKLDSPWCHFLLNIPDVPSTTGLTYFPTILAEVRTGTLFVASALHVFIPESESHIRQLLAGGVFINV